MRMRNCMRICMQALVLMHELLSWIALNTLLMYTQISDFLLMLLLLSNTLWVMEISNEVSARSAE